MSPPDKTSVPALTVVPPVYEFAPLKVRVSEVVLFSPNVPANTAETVPDLPSNANPVEVNVPSATVPPNR